MSHIVIFLEILGLALDRPLVGADDDGAVHVLVEVALDSHKGLLGRGISLAHNGGVDGEIGDGDSHFGKPLSFFDDTSIPPGSRFVKSFFKKFFRQSDEISGLPEFSSSAIGCWKNLVNFTQSKTRPARTNASARGPTRVFVKMTKKILLFLIRYFDGHGLLIFGRALYFRFRAYKSLSKSGICRRYRYQAGLPNSLPPTGGSPRFQPRRHSRGRSVR